MSPWICFRVFPFVSSTIKITNNITTNRKRKVFLTNHLGDLGMKKRSKMVTAQGTSPMNAKALQLSSTPFLKEMDTPKMIIN